MNEQDHDYGKDAIALYHRIRDVPPEELKEGNRFILYDPGDFQCEAVLRYDRESGVWVGDVVEGSTQHNLRIEADVRLKREHVKAALLIAAISVVTVKFDGIIARSTQSNLTVESWENVVGSFVKTLSIRQFPFDNNWSVAMRLHMTQNADKFMLSHSEIRQFCKALSEVSDSYFVLSNEYSCASIVRDSHGFRILR